MLPPSALPSRTMVWPWVFSASCRRSGWYGSATVVTCEAVPPTTSAWPPAEYTFMMPPSWITAVPPV